MFVSKPQISTETNVFQPRTQTPSVAAPKSGGFPAAFSAPQPFMNFAGASQQQHFQFQPQPSSTAAFAPSNIFSSTIPKWEFPSAAPTDQAQPSAMEFDLVAVPQPPMFAPHQQPNPTSQPVFVTAVPFATVPQAPQPAPPKAPEIVSQGSCIGMLPTMAVTQPSAPVPARPLSDLPSFQDEYSIPSVTPKSPIARRRQSLTNNSSNKATPLSQPSPRQQRFAPYANLSFESTALQRESTSRRLVLTNQCCPVPRTQDDSCAAVVDGSHHSRPGSQLSSRASSPTGCRTNPLAPKAPQREGYYFVPSADEMAVMSHSELASVKGLIVGHKTHGFIRFVGCVDVRGLDLESLVSIEHHSLEVHPTQDMLLPGQGLNNPAIITLLNVHCPAHCNVAKFERALRSAVQSDKSAFLHFDDLTGEWSFRANHF